MEGIVMLGTQLKLVRKAQKMTQSELAHKMGITQQAIGKWETNKSSPDPDSLMQLAEIFNVSVDFLLGRALNSNTTVPFVPKNVINIPVIGTVRAGYGALAYEDDYGTETADVKDAENYFYLIVRGQSMEPRILDGDLALVRRQPTLEDGDLGVIVYGEGEGTLKRFCHKGNAIVLQPFNPAYETLVLTGEEINQLHIAGKVIETKARW